MKSKPHKWGYKFWLMCDPWTGYCHAAPQYLGRKHDEKAEIGQGRKVVEVLMSATPPGTVACADRFFGSLATCQWMLDHGRHFIGTVRSDSLGFPLQLSQPGKTAFAKERGKTVFTNMKYNNAKITALRWQDRNPVLYVSTMGSGGFAGTVQRGYATKQDKKWKQQ